MPTEAAWFGEPVSAQVRRSLGLGLYGRRLPACYEVVDAELHAILLALQETVGQGDAAARRCLIMSDSLTAIEMIERAWREGIRADGCCLLRAWRPRCVAEVPFARRSHQVGAARCWVVRTRMRRATDRCGDGACDEGAREVGWLWTGPCAACLLTREASPLV